ncbi:MAG TPA: sensor histidine kinase [Gaiellaceae bacterium]|nr:sensor histidine kinase [Gaiellaceae bacterium]
MRRVLFAVSGLASGTLAFGLLLAGWIAVPLLCLTPLASPALVAFRAAIGGGARAEGQLANRLLGTEVGRNRLTSGGAGYWGRARAVAQDAMFWREQGYLLARVLVAWPLGVGVVTLFGSSLGLIGMPISYRFVNEHVGSWHVDSLERAVLLVPLGVIGVVLSLATARGVAAAWRRFAVPLLEPGRAPAAPAVATRVLLTALVDAVVLVVWALTGAGTFWPGWVIIATGLVLALFGWRKVVGWVVSLGVFVVLVWVLAGGGTFWPVWPLLALAVVLALWWLFVRSRGRLEERIETLETTRAGAVDVQESELRRIERDLHDGAQARLVALGMNLGMAEQKLAVDPEAARDLVTEARLGVEEALRELRDLARGIHPPVLTDRGLEAAIAALANRSAVPVFVDADVRERPPAAVETAAYFVAAEALTNAAKHAGATRIDVRVLREPGTLRVQVSDDGRGDADPAGSGLTGLRHRVEALDGRLTVVSPPGGGTTLLAELPCAS